MLAVADALKKRFSCFVCVGGETCCYPRRRLCAERGCVGMLHSHCSCRYDTLAHLPVDASASRHPQAAQDASLQARARIQDSQPQNRVFTTRPKSRYHLSRAQVAIQPHAYNNPPSTLRRPERDASISLAIESHGLSVSHSRHSLSQNTARHVPYTALCLQFIANTILEPLACSVSKSRHI